MKATKESVNYRYPNDCCGRCKGAYVNTMGDYQCSCLIAGNTIDLGGICDLYVKDEAPTPAGQQDG